MVYNLRRLMLFSPLPSWREAVLPSDISRAFEAQNRVVDAGGIDAGVNRIRIESTGNFYSLDDIRNLTIVSRTGEHFRLRVGCGKSRFYLNLIISVVTVVAILLFFIGFKNGLLIGSGLVFPFLQR